MKASKLTSVGDRIRAARVAAHLSQPELSTRCGWAKTNSRIGNYEQNKREPSYDDLTKIAGAIGIDPAFLAFGLQSMEFVHSIEIPYFESLAAMESGKGKARMVELIYPTAVSPRAFCIPVPSAHFRPFDKGELIVIDPETKPKAETYVALHSQASALIIVRCAEVKAVPLYRNITNDELLPATTHRDHFIGAITSSIILHH